MISRIFLFVICIQAAGCATGFDRDDPIDQALKLCGLGYSTGNADSLSAAVQYAERQGGMNVEAATNEYFETQALALAGRAAHQSGDMTILREEARDQRECAVKTLIGLRPKTQSQLEAACVEDLQRKVATAGSKTYPKVRNAIRVEHPKVSGDDFAMSVFVDHRGTSSYSALIQCDVHKGGYDGLVVLDGSPQR